MLPQAAVCLIEVEELRRVVGRALGGVDFGDRTDVAGAAAATGIGQVAADDALRSGDEWLVLVDRDELLPSAADMQCMQHVSMR